VRAQNDSAYAFIRLLQGIVATRSVVCCHEDHRALSTVTNAALALGRVKV